MIVGSSVTMFIGAMIMGPLGAWLIKKFDNLVGEKSSRVLRCWSTHFQPVSSAAFWRSSDSGRWPGRQPATIALGNAAQWITSVKLLPLIAVLVEPGKILFLNNAINHGIFDPVGISQVKAMGKSVFFLLESDPGPGVGVLLAYCFFGKGSAKQSAPGAVIIEFFGGIHEIYFPYI